MRNGKTLHCFQGFCDLTNHQLHKRHLTSGTKYFSLITSCFLDPFIKDSLRDNLYLVISNVQDLPPNTSTISHINS